MVLGAGIVTESAWLYGVLAVAALAAGVVAIAWPLVLLTMGVSAVLVRVGLFDRLSDRLSAGPAGLLRAVIAVAFIYVVVAFTVATDQAVVNLAWIASLSYEAAPEGFVLSAFAAVAAAMALWLRGAKLATFGRPEATLSVSFRIGLGALALATFIDVLHPADIGIFPVLFVFFASGLAGLSIGLLMPESSDSAKSGAWPRVIALVVAAVVTVGVAFSLLHRPLLSFLSSQFDTLGSIGKGLLLVIIAPLAIIFEFFNSLVFSFFGRPFDPEVSETTGRIEPREFEPAEAAGGSGAGTVSDFPATESVANFDALLQMLWYLFLAAVALVVVIVLALAIRRLTVSRSLGARGDPEDLKGDANALSDLARLLANIVPRWARKSGKRRLRLPDGPPGVVEALRIYYDLVTLAEKRGSARSPDQTPTEYQPSLEGIFPGNLVRAATAAFNRAFYGHIPATDLQISEMRTAMAPIKSGSRLTKGRGR